MKYQDEEKVKKHFQISGGKKKNCQLRILYKVRYVIKLLLK